MSTWKTEHRDTGDGWAELRRQSQPYFDLTEIHFFKSLSLLLLVLKFKKWFSLFVKEKRAKRWDKKFKKKDTGGTWNTQNLASHRKLVQGSLSVYSYWVRDVLHFPSFLSGIPSVVLQQSYLRNEVVLMYYFILFWCTHFHTTWLHWTFPGASRFSRRCTCRCKSLLKWDARRKYQT